MDSFFKGFFLLLHQRENISTLNKKNPILAITLVKNYIKVSPCVSHLYVIKLPKVSFQSEK